MLLEFSAAVYVLHCFQKKGNQRHRQTEAGARFDLEPTEGSGSPRKGTDLAMEIEVGSTNVCL